MGKIRIFYFTFMALSFNQIAFGEVNHTQIEKLYRQSCATCHGKNAEKPALGKSKIINQLNSDEIKVTLTERKNSKVEGAGNIAKQRLSNEEIKALAEWLPKLKRN